VIGALVNVCPLGRSKQFHADQDGLVLTAETTENILRLLDIAELCECPILLEGPTGCGKSRTVEAAAAFVNGKRGDIGQHGLDRCNMSSSIGIDDLLGKLHLGEHGLTMRLQPFAAAFSEGRWLLLDELNLAQDTVLQCIETALDTGVLDFPDPTQPDGRRVLERHGKFRLFATQNPGSGLFKGKREQLSASFFDRFIPMYLLNMGEDGWKDICEDMFFKSPGELLHGEIELLVDQCMGIFKAVQKRLRSDAEPAFPENGPQKEITVRDLLQLIKHVRWYALVPNSPLKNSVTRDAAMAFEAWCIFAARFQQAGRNVVGDVIQQQPGWFLPSIRASEISCECRDRDGLPAMKGNRTIKLNFTLEAKEVSIKAHHTYELLAAPGCENIGDANLASFVWVQASIEARLLATKFLNEHGLFLDMASWPKVALQLWKAHSQYVRIASSLFALTPAHSCYRPPFRL
jgi:hypothetical protein